MYRERLWPVWPEGKFIFEYLNIYSNENFAKEHNKFSQSKFKIMPNSNKHSKKLPKDFPAKVPPFLQIWSHCLWRPLCNNSIDKCQILMNSKRRLFGLKISPFVSHKFLLKKFTPIVAQRQWRRRSVMPIIVLRLQLNQYLVSAQSTLPPWIPKNLTRNVSNVIFDICCSA